MTITVCMTEEEAAEFFAWRASKMSDRDKRLDESIVDWFDGYLRVQNCLLNAHIEFVKDIIGKSEKDLLRLHGFGYSALSELITILNRHDIVLAQNSHCRYPVFQFKGKLEASNVRKD